VKTDDVLVVLGVADAELIFAAADAIGDGDGKAALATVERLSRSGRDTTQFIRDLIAHLRQLVVVHTAEAVPESFAVTAGQEDRLRSQAETIGDVALVRAIDELSAAIAAIREWGDDPRTALELALLKSLAGQKTPGPKSVPAPNPAEPDMGASPPRRASGAAPPASEPQDQSGGGEHGGSAPSAPVPGASPAEDSAGTDSPVDFERVAGLWPAVLDHMRQSGSVLLSAVFASARPIAVDAERDVLEVGFPPSAAFNKRKAEAEANRERLAEAVRTIVGEGLRPVYVLLDSDEGAGESNGEPELSEDELVERLKAEFDAEERSAEAEERSAGEGTA
jgi:DNA polymerase-3 subunit gamma/tau